MSTDGNPDRAPEEKQVRAAHAVLVVAVVIMVAAELLLRFGR